MKKIHKLLGLLLALMMVFTLLASCGPASPETDETEPGLPVATDPNDEEDSKTESGRNDASIAIGTHQVVTSLSPLGTTAGHLYTYCIPLYERLMYLNGDGEYVPWLLKEYTAASDGVTFDFEIYDYIYDSAGNHITAEDVVFAIEKNVENNMKPDFGKVVSVEATGDYSVRLVVNQDMVFLFQSLMWNTDMFSKKAFEASEDGMASKAISTSQYEVTEYIPESIITYERRDDYWQTDASLIPKGMEANTKTMTFKVITETSQSIVALETGVVDMVDQIDASTAAAYIDNKDFDYDITDDKEGKTLFFSGVDSSPVANDLNLRLAICHALDPDAFVQGDAHGSGDVMYDVCVDSGLGYLEKWNSEEYFPYNPELAKEYLAKSDYDGEELVIMALSNGRRRAEILQSYCEAVGIKVKLNVLDWALLSQLRLDGSAWDLFIWSINTSSLPYNWSIRYDCNAYSTGDATGRRDYDLAELLYETWTIEGFTEENIDKVHNYLKDNAYARGLYKAYTYTLVRADAGMKNVVNTYYGHIAPWATNFNDA